MSRKRGLGKGLDVLLGEVTSSTADAGGGELRRLPVEYLQRGRYQPRREIDPAALQELTESIRAQGILQPLVVRRLGEQQYEIVAGERRWRAAQAAGLDQVPVIVRDISDDVALAVALIENIQREDLNPLEEAMALQRLAQEFGMTHQEVAQAVGRSRAAVSNLLRLLELNDDVKQRLQRGELEMGHARALLPLKGAQQSAAAAKVVERALSVRETEALVRRLLQGASSAQRSGGVLDPDIRRLQDDLSRRLGAAVSIQQGARGAGKLVIRYSSLDELDGILAHFRS